MPLLNRFLVLIIWINVALPISEECFVTDGIVKLSIFNIYKTLFYAENTGFYFWSL